MNKPLLSAFVAAALAACTPIVELRGNLPTPEALAQIKPGETTQDEVMTLLGTPSTTMTYGGEEWHYISSKTEYVAFLAPVEKERTVISIAFDLDGKVKTMDRRGLKDGKAVETVSRETPSAGKEMSVIEQLVGNVGRFKKDAEGKK
jgi:outer membrane protein assembly factor BamE (lipoprotein component of BamABCDE complex)